MNFLKNTQACIQRSQSIVRMFFTLALLTLGASVALAQGVPPNMDFYDYISGNTVYNSTGRAFKGRVGGYVHGGRIRGGKLSRLAIGLDPDNNGPNGLKRMVVFYDEDIPNHNAFAPRGRWYTVNATTKRLVITNVRATQEFIGTSTYSLGAAKVEITFINGAPGKLIVSYSHREYKRLYGDPTLPRGVKRYNGTVFSGSPTDGHRLQYELR